MLCNDYTSNAGSLNQTTNIKPNEVPTEIIKEEELSRSTFKDERDEVNPPEFVDVSLISNEAGPSGLQKDFLNMDGVIGTSSQRGCLPVIGNTQDVDIQETECTNKNQSDELIVCQICGKFFKTTFWFGKHMKNHVENKCFTCDLCGKSFKLNSVLRSHQREIHSTVKKFGCLSCNYSTNNKTNFENHVKIKHTDVNVHGKNCDVCGAKFFRNEDIMRHKIKEHNAPRFQCLVCNKSYTSKQYLNIHQAIHNPNFKPEHQCVTCGKMFPNIGHLSSHIRSRHLGLRYDCKECGKSVSSRASLRDHMNIHTGEKPYSCNMCNKAFGARKYLRIHQRSHTGEKPYSCQQCDKTFTQRGSLVIHERYHSGDRPYQCLLCLKSFVAHSLLKNHMKSHKNM